MSEINLQALMCNRCGKNLEACNCAALPPVRSEPMFSISRFRSVLVKHGIIGRDAIDDAANYDGGRTLAATRAAYDELVENTALTGGVLAVPSNGVVGG
jgi:DTW domain-containing protein YfiP